MATETELVVRIANTGAAQTVRDVAKLQSALQQLGKNAKDTRAAAAALGKAFNLPAGDVEDLAKALAQAKDESDKLTKSAGGLGSVLQGVFQGVGQQATQLAVEAVKALGAAIADTAKKALDVAGAFDAAGAKVDTLGVDSGALAAQLQGVVSELGGQASQLELLEGSYDIVSAGFSDVGDVAKIAEASVKGATGGFSDFATVSDAVTSALNAYGESADQASAFVDKFIATQNAGKITVEQYAQQIGQLAPTAALAGVGIDELNGFIATATAQGVPVQSTFAGIRQAIANTLKPSSDAAKFAKELGIEFSATALEAGGLEGILLQLNERGLDSAENLLRLFGSVEAVAAIAPSAGANIDTLRQNIDASVNSAGNATEAFQTVADTIPGLQTALGNQLTDSFLALGNAIAPIQAGVLQFAGDLLAATAAGSDGFAQLTAAAERFRVVLTQNPEIAQRLGDALATVANVGVDQISQLIDAITAFVSEQENIDALAASIEDLALVITTAGQTARFIVALADSLTGLGDAADRIPVIGDLVNFNPVGPLANVQQLIGAFTNLRNVLTNVAEFVANLIARFDILAESPIIAALLAQILETEAAVGGLGEAIGGGLGDAAAALGQAGGQVQDSLKGVGDSAEDGADRTEVAVEKIEDALKRLGDANKSSLADLSTDAANARAAILEAGGDPAQLAELEAQTLRDRIQNNRDFLAELEALQSGGGLSAEDAASVADQIRGVDAQLASDRVSLAQAGLAEQKRIEDERVKAAEAAAKATTDALKAQRDEEKRIADQRQADAEKAAQRENDDARDGRTEAREAQRRAEDKALQQELQASDRAFQDQRRNADRAFQQQQQAEAQAFQQSQQAAAQAFQRRLDAERDQGGREFDVLTDEVERRIQLQQAADAESRRALQEQFAEEDRLLKERRKIEAEVLAQRGQVLGQRQEETQVGPLEQARLDFEERLQARQQAFANTQQANAQAFQEEQAAEAEARAEALRLEDQQRADDRAAADETRAEARRAEDKAFEDEERAIQDQFEAQQRAAKEAFNAQQRSLDEASARQIAAILEAARPNTVAISGARRDGGPVRAGMPYLVGEDGPEIVTPRRGGYVLTAQQTAALMAGVPGGRRGLSVPSVGGQGEVVRKLDELIATVKKRPPVRPQATYNLSTATPQADAVAMQMQELRALVLGGGL